MVTALILAGGKSSRMGTDKALIQWQGIPLLKHICQQAYHCCSETVVLTPWPEKYTSLVPPPTQIIQETQAHQGPLVALEQGFSAIQTPWVLLLACDLPCLKSSILQTWIEQLSTLPPSTLAQVPYHQHHWEPLCGFYRVRSHPHLKTFINQGGRSFQKWLNLIPTQRLTVDNETALMLRNCNTPVDLAALKKENH